MVGRDIENCRERGKDSENAVVMTKPQDAGLRNQMTKQQDGPAWSSYF